MSEQNAPAKINLALVVGPRREDGRHEVTTVLERVDLADRVVLQPAPRLRVDGFPADTLVGQALRLIAEAADAAPRWRVRIEKRIPVAAGLAGGSSDAAAALRLANATLPRPLADEELHELGCALGADVPFFLTQGTQLGEGDGTQLTPLRVRRDYTVLLVLPDGVVKESTAAIYAAFDARSGANGYAERRASLLAALGAGDLAALPPNDLASSPVAGELRELGAIRADVSGAGPCVYGLFESAAAARAAARAFAGRARTWLASPAC